MFLKFFIKKTSERLPHHYSLDRISQEDLGVGVNWSNTSSRVGEALTPYSLQSQLGKIVLGIWISNPLLDTEAIRQRQIAAQELRENVHARQKLKQNFHTIHQILTELHSKPIRYFGYTDPPVFPDGTRLEDLASKVRFHRIPDWIIRSLSLLCLAASYFAPTMLLPAIAVLGPMRQSLSDINQLQWRLRMLGLLFAEIQDLEMNLQGLTSERIVEQGESFAHFRSCISSKRRPRSKSLIQHLRSLRPASRLGSALELITGMASNRLPALAKKVRNILDEALPSALVVAGELEILCRSAELLEKGYIFPLIYRSETPSFEFTQLHHPYIYSLNQQESVPNDVMLSTASSDNRFAMVTGPNFSGKTVFIKAVGTGLIIGQAGLPLAMQAGRFTPMRIVSSMRVVDSITDSASLFSAQARRSKWVLFDSIKDTTPRVLLIDEVAGGTSATERQAFEAAFVKTVLQQNALVLLTTHQHNLVTLADSHPNMCNLVTSVNPPFVVQAGSTTYSDAARVLDMVDYPEQFMNFFYEELACLGVHKNRTVPEEC